MIDLAAPSESPAVTICSVPIAQIDVHLFARAPNEISIAHFTTLLADQGFISPLIGRRTSAGRVEIADGQCRLIAAQRLGISDVPVALAGYSDPQMFWIALYANTAALQDEIWPLELARGIHRLLELGVTKTYLTSILPYTSSELDALQTLTEIASDDYTLAQLRSCPRQWDRLALIATIRDRNIRHTVVDRMAQERWDVDSTRHVVDELNDRLAAWAYSEQAFLEGLPIMQHYHEAAKRYDRSRIARRVEPGPDPQLDATLSRALFTTEAAEDFAGREGQISVDALLTAIESDLAVINVLLDDGYEDM